MKTQAIHRLLFHLLLAGALLFAGGCATERRVNSIIAQSNAAMIPQVLQAPGESNEGWQTSVEQINQLIAAQQDQPVIANQLRLRAAMLLTVNNQGSLATEEWQKIDRASLQTERDRALFDNASTLVWWYGRSTSPSPLAGAEVTRAQSGLSNLTATLATLKAPEIKIFLGTIRAGMGLKLSNDAAVNTAAQQSAVAAALANDLKAYLDLYSAADVAWVRANKATVSAPQDRQLSTLRNRIWLRELIKQYKITAANQDLKPQWSPDWIASF